MYIERFYKASVCVVMGVCVGGGGGGGEGGSLNGQIIR